MTHGSRTVRFTTSTLVLGWLAACGASTQHGGDESEASPDTAATDDTSPHTADAGRSSSAGKDASAIDPSNGTSGKGSSSDAGLRDAGAVSRDAATSAHDAAASTSDNATPSCAAGSLNQTGCSCDKPDETRACYTGPTATRGIGACRDGTQTCAAAGEFGNAYTDCVGETLPEGNNCTVSTPVDAGIPPGCRMVRGFNGNGMLGDGTLFCEGDMGGGGPGGILGGFFGP